MTPVISLSLPLLRILTIVIIVLRSKTSSRVSVSSLDFIRTLRSRSYRSSRFLSFSSTLSDTTFTRGCLVLALPSGQFDRCNCQVRNYHVWIVRGSTEQDRILIDQCSYSL